MEAPPEIGLNIHIGTIASGMSLDNGAKIPENISNNCTSLSKLTIKIIAKRLVNIEINKLIPSTAPSINKSKALLFLKNEVKNIIRINIGRI